MSLLSTLRRFFRLFRVWRARHQAQVPTLAPVPTRPEVPPPAPAPASQLSALRISGKFFEWESGTRWTLIGCSDFRLFARFLGGDDIRPVLEERQTLGFNTLRVFGMAHFMFSLAPQEFVPAYFDALPHFLTLLEAHGLRCEWTAFADARHVMPTHVEQDAYAATLTDVLRPWARMVFFELVNENDQTMNTIDTTHFVPPDGLISCHGSNGADARPVIPPWEYVTYHPTRPADWPRRVGHNAMEWADFFGVPCLANETTRPDQGRGPVAADFFDAAANGALLSAGATFHSEAGKHSRLFSPVELVCAEAWVRGARSISLEFQRGKYTARHLHDSPVESEPMWSASSHGRILGDRACVVETQRTNAYRVVPRPGWTVTREQDSVLELRREGA